MLACCADVTVEDGALIQPSLVMRVAVLLQQPLAGPDEQGQSALKCLKVCTHSVFYYAPWPAQRGRGSCCGLQVVSKWIHAQPDQALFCALAALLCAHLAGAASLVHYQSQAAALGRRALAQLGNARTGISAAGCTCMYVQCD